MRKKEKSLQAICMDFVNTRSEESYKVAIDRLRPGLWRHLSKYESDKDSCNFLLTSTFAKMWSEISKYSPEKAHFSTWIYRVARNEALQHKRYTNRHTSYTELVENGSKVLAANSPDVLPDEFFDEKVTYDATMTLYEKVMSVIENMDSDNDKNDIFRDALKMRLVEGRKYSDIADSLGIKESTAKVRVHNGKKILRKMIEKADPELVSDFHKMMM